MTVATKSVLQIKSGPLQKQQVSLTTEQSLQPLCIYLFTENLTVIASQKTMFLLPSVVFFFIILPLTSASYQHSLKLNFYVSAVAKHCWCSSSITLPSKQTAGMHLHSYPGVAFSFSAWSKVSLCNPCWFCTSICMWCMDLSILVR